MRNLIVLLTSVAAFFSCQENESVSEFTGNQTTYALQQASTYAVNGSVTFKEKKDGGTLVLLELSGTDGDVQLPAHLHLGDIATPGADVAALLTPVSGLTGKSETTLVELADETAVTYEDLINLEACIKVHLSDFGVERNIILAGGNIGAFSSKGFSSGRVGIGICKSE